MDLSQTIPQSHVISQQMMRNNSQTSLRFSQPPQQQKQQQSGMLPELPGNVGPTLNPLTNQLSAGAGQSAVTDDVPSCSTSPSANNCPNGIQLIMNSRNHNEIAQSSSVSLLNPSNLETLLQKGDGKPPLNAPKSQNQGFFASQTYLNGTGTHVDYLDSSSSATSVLSHNELQIPPSNNSMSFQSQSLLFRDACHDEVQGDPRNNVPFEANIDNQLAMSMMPETLITKDMVGSGKDFETNISSGGGMLSGFDNPKEAQPELSSSMVSQSFGVPDMTFNSIDSTINDGNFMNRGAWAPPPQIPRMRTYTKVYKRGAVGRSIDMTRYAGYDDLKQDLARRFGIEGQLEGRQRVGWKLVYVDHENDVLLVGDDPWEEFVNCVRCIKILSPQEVQQMSLAGDFENNVLPNQACSSSDNGAN